MVGNLRIRNIKELLLDVIASDVKGDFAEFGVWRGGSCIFAAGLFEVMGVKDRQVHVFDASGNSIQEREVMGLTITISL
jgi:hypothetical protein